MIFTIINNQTFIGTIPKLNEYSLKSVYINIKSPPTSIGNIILPIL